LSSIPIRTLLASRVVFDGSSLKSIAIPHAVTEIGIDAFIGCNLTSFSADAGNESFAVDGCLLLSRDDTQFVRCIRTLATVVILSPVEVIGKGCFRDNWLPVAVEFGAGSRLRLIEEDAFMMSSLARIAIPRAVTVMCATCRALCTLSE